jgi:FHA domain
MANQKLTGQDQRNAAGHCPIKNGSLMQSDRPLSKDDDHQTVEHSLISSMLRSQLLDQDCYLNLGTQWGKIKLQTNLPHTDQLHTSDHLRWLIGRSRYCAVVIPDARISRYHAIISYDVHHNFYVMDTGSHNGTFLNQSRLPPFQYYRLSDGDLVALSYQTIHINIHQHNWRCIHDFFGKHH